MRRLMPISMAALALAACSSRYDPQGEPTMYSHFSAADDIQAAVVHGDLKAVREPASWLAEHDIPSLPEGSDTYLAEFQAFARAARQATNLEDAADATAGMAMTCGACHQQNIAEPVTKNPLSPKTGRDVTSHMARHAWAAERLWEGLVIPSDARWVEGSQVLRESPLKPAAMAGASSEDLTVQKQVELLEKRAHSIGTRAETVTDSEERAELYGELLSTCAHCHQLTGQEFAAAR